MSYSGHNAAIEGRNSNGRFEFKRRGSAYLIRFWRLFSWGGSLFGNCVSDLESGLLANIALDLDVL